VPDCAIKQEIRILTIAKVELRQKQDEEIDDPDGATLGFTL
jgi:hypothetical protein